MKKVLELAGSHHNSPSTETNGAWSPKTPDALPAEELCCIPDYLLEATSEYREGKQYYEACHFDEAQSKFVNSVNCIAMNDPIHMKANDFFSPLTSAIIAFINEKCDQSTEKKPVVRSRNDSKEHVPSLSDLSRSSQNMGQLFHDQPERWGDESDEQTTSGKTEEDYSKECGHPIEALLNALKNAEQPLPQSCSNKNRIFLSNDVLQGVICVMLTDIVMALALCHQMKGEHQEYRELYHASTRLHSIIYGPESLKPVISSGNLQKFFPQECCGDLVGGEILLQDPLPHVYIQFDALLSNYSDYDVGFCEMID